MTTFREITQSEIPQVLDMVRERMTWMNEKGIHHWNDFAYDELFPLSYYEEKARLGELYVLAEEGAGEILCAAVLLEHDTRWEDDPPAIYLHNFVSRIGTSGVGTAFMKAAEQYAADQGKRYFRLDSAVDSPALERYYTAMGYVPVGTCKEGAYEGILRQKEL